MDPARWGRVEEIYQAAAERRPEERAAFLAVACAGDDDLQREVESLLAQPSGDGMLDRPAWAPDRSRLTAEESGTQMIDTAAAAGDDDFGRYRILRPLGEGGMGSVYLAEQLEPIRRRVALKVVKLGMDTAQVLVRFNNERQALAMMDHPNIAQIFDAGATAKGRPYFVMEYIEGSPITEYCDGKRMTIKERLALFLAVCRAVQHAHQKGVIHRDLKPSNVLVTEKGLLRFAAKNVEVQPGAERREMEQTVQ
jgi:non-specific serine/threonine protein kinase/serine/threonine-protein kinase